MAELGDYLCKLVSLLQLLGHNKQAAEHSGKVRAVALIAACIHLHSYKTLMSLLMVLERHSHFVEHTQRFTCTMLQRSPNWASKPCKEDAAERSHRDPSAGPWSRRPP